HIKGDRAAGTGAINNRPQRTGPVVIIVGNYRRPAWRGESCRVGAPSHSRVVSQTTLFISPVAIGVVLHRGLIGDDPEPVVDRRDSQRNCTAGRNASVPRYRPARNIRDHRSTGGR